MNAPFLRGIIALILPVVFPLITSAQPSGPDYLERARPTLDEDRLEREAQRPYLMSNGRFVDSPYFLNVNTIVESAGSARPQNESSIAVNPLDPSMLLASAVDYRAGGWAYLSFDAGRTWRNVGFGDVRTGWATGNDPSVAFDHLGNAYVMYGAIYRDTANPKLNMNSGIYIAKSTDRGTTWIRHIPIIEHRGERTLDSFFEDKYYIEVDRSASSPYRGWVYTPWKRIIDRDSSTQIMFARSTDGGQTWSAPVAVSPRKPGTSLDTTFGQSFPLAACDPNGVIHLVWNDGTARSIGYARSTDGGATFSAPRHIVTGYPTLGTARKLGPDVYHVLKGTFRVETYPTLMADNSNSPRRGWLYMAWAAGLQPDVYFIRSTDAGATWSTPRVIHSDTTNDQFWPWLSVDPTSGNLAVMFSDSRHDTANILIDQYVAFSSDGGTTWIDRRATSFMSDYRQNPFEGIFAGDYAGNAFFGGKIYPSFVDTRDDNARKDNDVFTARMNIAQPWPVENLSSRTDPTQLEAITLTWQNPSDTTSIFGLPVTGRTIVVQRDSVRVAVLAADATELMQDSLEHGREYVFSVSIAAGPDTSAPRTLKARVGGAKEPAAPEIVGFRELGDTIEIEVRAPAVRADGAVPLANLDAIRLWRDDTVRKEIPLYTSDTGRVITVRDMPWASGYHVYAATAIDAVEPPNESARSNTIVAYVGTLDPFVENFDAPAMPLWYLTGRWGRTSTLALSAPNSLTDSPAGFYGPAQKLPVQLPRVRVSGPVELRFAQIAIVDTTDTATVEVEYDRDGTWHEVARFNAASDSRWSDMKAAAGDWRQEFFTIRHPSPGPISVATVRFRLATNITRQADGWYIDDVAFGQPAGIDAGYSDLMASAHPNPFSGALILEYNHVASAPVEVRLLDVLGSQVYAADLGYRPSGRGSVTIDAGALPAGTYWYELRSGGSIERGRVVKVR